VDKNFNRKPCFKLWKPSGSTDLPIFLVNSFIFNHLTHLRPFLLLFHSVWLMGVMAVVGNGFVIVSRMVLREKNRVHSFYIKNLAMADLIMGIFLLCIAFHDVSFRGEFLARQHAWRHSLTCQFSGKKNYATTTLLCFWLKGGWKYVSWKSTDYKS